MGILETLCADAVVEADRGNGDGDDDSDSDEAAGGGFAIFSSQFFLELESLFTT